MQTPSVKANKPKPEDTAPAIPKYKVFLHKARYLIGGK